MSNGHQVAVALSVTAMIIATAMITLFLSYLVVSDRESIWSNSIAKVENEAVVYRREFRPSPKPTSNPLGEDRVVD